MPKKHTRRDFAKAALAATAAGSVAMGLEEQVLLAELSKAGGGKGKARAKGAADMPMGQIGKLKISRLICGGNLFSGSAHSRKLIYVSRLMRQYFSPEKIMDTLQLCEAQGINTAVMRCDKHITGVLARYRKERGGKIQWLAQTYPRVKDLTGNIQMAVDNGAVGAFMQGGIGDRFVADGRLEMLGKVIAFVKKNGLVAGVGSHSLDVPRAVEKAGLEPDFYFKTINGVAYNTQNPQEIAELMKTVSRPWIAFKVLGAGAVRPRDGFELALRMGADFLTVGMFDFQVAEDARTIAQVAANVKRDRPWRG
jgi:hypothetical protein